MGLYLGDCVSLGEESLQNPKLLTKALVHIWALLSALNFDTHGQHEKQRVVHWNAAMQSHSIWTD